MSESSNDKNNNAKTDNHKNKWFFIPQTSANIPIPNVNPPKDDNSKPNDEDK